MTGDLVTRRRRPRRPRGSAARLSPAEYAVCHAVNPDTGKPLSWAGYEYLLQPLEDLAPRLCLQKGAQVGATVLAILRALWFVEVRRVSALYLFPTQRLAQRFARGRFTLLVQQAPRLAARFRRVGGAEHWCCGAAHFYCHGARSRVELLSIPVASLTLDERDELSTSSGNHPWNAVDLARQRLAGQPDAWELSLSTPTIPGRGIAAEFAASDQHRFHPRCPHCARLVELSWPAAVEGVEDGPLQAARFCCPACRRPWTADERRAALWQGCWIAACPGQTTRGYHLSQLLSPTAAAPRLVRLWRDAQADPAALQVFHNAVLGLPYVVDGMRLEHHWISEALARGGYRMLDRSTGSVLGVDVGPTWLHVVLAEPTSQGFRIIWAGKLPSWAELADLIPRFQVRAFVIDAQPETHAARAFVQRFPQGWLCYYRGGPVAQPSTDPTRRLLHVPRTESLDALYRCWRQGAVAAPLDLPHEFAPQLQALVRLVRLGKDGQPRADYVDTGPDHYAHAMNYCHLALRGLDAGAPRFDISPPARGWIP